MKRNTTLTMMLMVGSIAAAAAAPELPADLATVACAEQVALAPSLPVAVRHDVRGPAPKQSGSSASRQELPAAACEPDVTAPYRLAHHGSLKLDPICQARATT